MSLYLYLLHPFRHDFFQHPAPQEQDVLIRHEEYLKTAHEAGKVMLAGLCPDGTFALVLLRAENEQDAAEFMFRDPAVQENLMAAELHPFYLDLFGGEI